MCSLRFLFVNVFFTPSKHTDPVWQVCWQEEDLAKNLNFFSISSDGRVTLWTMSKSELQYTDVMELKLTGIANSGGEDGGEETSLVGLAGGSSFDFHSTSEHLFIVGTEEGKIHKCSKAYNSQYLDSYNGHYMSVYAVHWNKFHPKVFLSSSADWTVKIWVCMYACMYTYVYLSIYLSIFKIWVCMYACM